MEVSVTIVLSAPPQEKHADADQRIEPMTRSAIMFESGVTDALLAMAHPGRFRGNLVRQVHRQGRWLPLLVVAWATLCLLISLPIQAAEPKQFDHSKVVHAVIFVEDGATLASLGGDGSVKFWDVATCKERATWKGFAKRVFSIAITTDGKIMAAGIDGRIGAAGLETGNVKLWDVTTRKERAGFGGAGGAGHGGRGHPGA